MDVFDNVLSFESYKEGIVQLFNRFYTYTRRKFEEVLDCLTPREFQRVQLKKIPGRGNHALEDLVSAFEIANYSEAYPSKLDYDKSYAAAEMLKELIQDG